MATRAEQARLYNNAIAQGLSEDQALAQAGITDPGDFNFSPDGQLEPTAVGPGLRPNETIVPAGTPLYGDSDEPDNEPNYRTTPVSSQTTTTSQNTVTGGGSRTTVVQPTQYQSTAASQSAQSAADRAAAEKAELSAQLKAEGKTGAEVLRDPRYRELSRQQQAAQTAADNAREPVPGTGGIAVTDTPGADSTTTYQSSSPTFVTNDAGIEDPYVQTQEVADTPAAVNNFATSDITDFTFEDNASLGYSEIPPDPEGGGIGFDYTEDFTDTGISPYGEEDEPFDPDFRSAPDPAFFTEEYVQEQDNPFEGIDYNTDDGISPYGEEDEPLDPVPLVDPFEVDAIGYGSAETEFEQDNPNIVTLNAPDPYEIDGANIGLTEEEIQQQDNPIDATQQQATLQAARAQQILRDQQKQVNQGDWRVKLRLAPGATYLYDDPNDPGILAPLSTASGTGGVVFPYTPQIITQYNATYNSYDLTHSNYRGYFYQGSHVGEVQLNATFTAQDTNEADYLLAVIHFFRSVTKMFYGRDAQRGAPPPLVFLEGMGQFQFNRHPCVVSQFNYTLPNDVDYIRARSPNISSTGLLQRRVRQDLPTNPFSSAWARLQAAGLFPGATVGNRSGVNVPTFGKNSPTYVPTKIEISLVLLPMQTRQQVSQDFSLKEFSNGKLIQKGFW